MKLKLSILLSFISCLGIYAQIKPSDSISRKKIILNKIAKSPKIDGVLDDEIWKDAAIAKDFVERRPNNGNAAPEHLKSVVKMAYDDTGIYIGAQLTDDEPHKIAKELTERDNIGNDDLFGITINGYNDHQQIFEFMVTAAGVQADAKYSSGESKDDFSWNAIWYSGVKINEQGWCVEMKIPYSELRFPKKDIQEWGINFFRDIQKNQSNYNWNHVDNKKGNFMLYDGILTGIQNINPPTRLSFMPYFSSYITNYSGTNTVNVNGGMDVKYGINDSFTLDLTLIPDFGQASFDKVILNLSPFEQKLQEQRAFFTEGTELFNKGNLFYSRRIGGSPSTSANPSNDEVVADAPAKVKLFNAVKISGRTNKGLGIGIFNAITEKAEASLRNTITGEIRKQVIEPWANYNVLVLDQRFHTNSSVTLINTNVTREGSFRDANVTGLLWDLVNKKNTYELSGYIKGSWVMENGTIFGNDSNISLNKISGSNRFGSNISLRTKDYNINDLGYTDKTNYVNYQGYYNYRILQPKGFLNQMYQNVTINYIRRLESDLFSQFIVNYNASYQNKKNAWFGSGMEFTPAGEYDIYEPRAAGRYLKVPGYMDNWIWYYSDERKKLYYTAEVDYYAYDQKARNKVNTILSVRYRFSNKFNLIWNGDITTSNREIGYVDTVGNDIFMGHRNRYTIENGITSQYTFNNKMALNLSFRHYYSEVDYVKFSSLNPDGSLALRPDYKTSQNETFNTWNIDLRYSWWFAPGSQITLLYRNSTQNYLNYSKLNLKENFKTLFNEPMVNSLSLKIVYYLDYNRAKRWF